jgi:hypothetical protein
MTQRAGAASRSHHDLMIANILRSQDASVARRCHSMWFTPRLRASHRGKKLVAISPARISNEISTPGIFDPSRAL